MCSIFRELFVVDSERAREFFLENLRETVGAKKHREDEIVYVAGVLAHYTLVSRFQTGSMPVMADLSEVFDSFILRQGGVSDPEIFEIGGSQVLLFAGFFRDQMRHRHNVEWYDEIGQSLYYRASRFSRSSEKQKLFDCLSESFPSWTLAACNMSRMLRQSQFLLRLN